jgi:hypothetical protein
MVEHASATIHMLNQKNQATSKQIHKNRYAGDSYSSKPASKPAFQQAVEPASQAARCAAS